MTLEEIMKPEKPRLEDEFLADLQEAIPGDWSREFKPSGHRRWSVDIVSVKLKIAIEIEGQRHGSAQQRRSDSEKQNYLAARGWRCLRYPASSVKTKKRRARILDQITRIVCNVPSSYLDSHVLTGE